MRQLLTGRPKACYLAPRAAAAHLLGARGRPQPVSSPTAESLGAARGDVNRLHRLARFRRDVVRGVSADPR